ncbi:unnamed protein product [Symbiodinium necroappetens]|uniref:TRP C-terminal domain-containing protein n=1 Tax=Symbiodinium necroappetens TaxID=1628268 RepID=A0A812T3A6_9DINO|nr:unnamed protein product [Symbiodinium necroappetens]
MVGLRDGRSALTMLLLLLPVLGRYDHEVNEALGRRLRSRELPEGLRLKEELNTSLALYVFPTWDLFLGFSDRHKNIQGKMSLTFFYYAESLRIVSDPQLIVTVDNFGDGTRYLQGKINLLDAQGYELFTTSNIYVGSFSQQQSNFDHLCYPFDNKTVKFDISIQAPGNYIFDLALLCPEPLLAENTSYGGEEIVTKCTYPAEGMSLGFEWGQFICEAKEAQKIQCSMTGVREWFSIFKGYFWPSFTFSAMGFISFTLSVKMSMPRVATTMLALISLTNLRNALVELLPASGETSWMEEYFLLAMTFMLLNLCGHAISFYLDALGKTTLQQMANRINLFGMVSIANLVVLARLHERNCPLVDRTLSTTLVVLSSLIVIFVFAAIAWCYRDSFREVSQIISQRMATRVVPVYKETDDIGDDSGKDVD